MQSNSYPPLQPLCLVPWVPTTDRYHCMNRCEVSYFNTIAVSESKLNCTDASEVPVKHFDLCEELNRSGQCRSAREKESSLGILEKKKKKKKLNKQTTTATTKTRTNKQIQDHYNIITDTAMYGIIKCQNAGTLPWVSHSCSTQQKTKGIYL